MTRSPLCSLDAAEHEKGARRHSLWFRRKQPARQPRARGREGRASSAQQERRASLPSDQPASTLTPLLAAARHVAAD